MQCSRCNGLMYTERFMDFDGVFDLWKCINCGALADPIIFQNQHLSAHLHSVESVEDVDVEPPEIETTPIFKKKAARIRYAASSS